MKRLLTLLILCSALFVMAQTPDTWTVTELHPHLSPIHNSITVKKGDSTIIVQFEYPNKLNPKATFPDVKDKITFLLQRKSFSDKGNPFDIIHVYNVSK